MWPTLSGASPTAQGSMSEEEVMALALARGHASDSDSDEAQVDPRRAFVAKVMDDTRLKLAVAAVILLNLLAMVWQADHPGDEATKEVNHAFLGAYSLEAGLRLFAYRWSFLFSSVTRRGWLTFTEPLSDEKELIWNRLDFGIVAFGWLDFVLAHVFSTTHTPGPIMMTMRTIRILRVVRVIRIFKFMRPLQDLIKGLLNSLVSVFWVMALLSTVMLVFAIYTTTEFGHQASEYADPEGISERWGTVWLSFRTLFSFLTLDDWSNMTRDAAWPRASSPLSFPVAMMSMLLLIGYTLLTAFVILSLLTGTMVEEMEKVRNDNQEEELEDYRDRLATSMDTFFEQFTAYSDRDERGCPTGLSQSSLRALLEDPECIQDMRAAGVDLTRYDTHEIFNAFDLDSSETVSWDEFKLGLLSLIPKKVSRKKFFKLNATMKSCLTTVSSAGTTRQTSKAVATAADRALTASVKRVARHAVGAERTAGQLRDGLEQLLVALRAQAGPAQRC